MASVNRRVYQCPECKNVVEVVYPEGGPAPSCCGKALTEIVPQTADAATEKHVPYIEKVRDGVVVKVGKETAHPMTPEHYIVYIEICADGLLMRRYLQPGDKPEAHFKTDAKNVSAREFCNIHKLWKSSL
ncbi:MAG: desulfoferrodoxin [Candidatus Methanoplasma sp.]|jgi:superoxide reductase|nr:desulfoferrodoxin [Candidatus Methanoplasma sp.]